MARNTRPISWIKAAFKDFEEFPEGAQLNILRALTVAAEGGKSDIAKPLKGFESGVFEIALPYRGDALSNSGYSATRHGYLGAARLSEEIKDRDQDSQRGDRFGQDALEAVGGGIEWMTNQ